MERRLKEADAWASEVKEAARKAAEFAGNDDLAQAAEWQKKQQRCQAQLVHGSFEPLQEDASEHGREVLPTPWPRPRPCSATPTRHAFLGGPGSPHGGPLRRGTHLIPLSRPPDPHHALTRARQAKLEAAGCVLQKHNVANEVEAQCRSLIARHSGQLEFRRESTLSLAAGLRRSGPQGEAKALLEEAAQLFAVASNAQAECEFGVAAACEGIQELLRRLWTAGPKGEVQALAAMGVTARLRRLCKQALGRMTGEEEGRFPGTPQEERYPSPLLSAEADPFAPPPP